MTRAGAPIALAWTTRTAWRATLSLTCGANAVQLDATDRHGLSVGTDATTVTRSGAGCP